MKKLYVLAGAFLMASGAFAQGHELFFSAYNEGAHMTGSTPPGGGPASNGKERAIQIFNPTTAIVNMNQYSIVRYSNGSTAPVEEEKLIRNKNLPSSGPTNNLASGDVYVYANFASTLLEITNVWDQQAADYTSSAPTVILKGGAADFNGNDALALRRWVGGAPGVAGQPGVGTPIIVDIFGVIGEDPNPGTSGVGTAWYSNPPVVASVVKTKDQSLVRKSHIDKGTTVNPNPATFQIADEWEVVSEWNGVSDPTGWYSQSYANLASHTFTGAKGSYNTTGLLEDFNKAITVYPNPVADKNVKIKIENTKVASVSILNGLGQTINVTPANALNQEISVNVAALKPGLYFVKFVSGDGNGTTIYKELIVQ